MIYVLAPKYIIFHFVYLSAPKIEIVTLKGINFLFMVLLNS